MSGEKKHAPTQKKLQDARKDGQVARTKDLAAWLGIAGAVATIPLVVTLLLPKLRLVFTQYVADVAKNPEGSNMVTPLRETLLGAAMALAPLAILCVVIAVGANAAQGGLLFATKSLKPKMDKLNPINGFKQMFSVKTLWEAAKSLIKTLVLGGVLWYTVSGMIPALMAAGTLHLSAVIDLAKSGVVDIVRMTVLVGLVLAVIDYIVTKKQMHKKLKMSDHDIKQEHKQSEGDPLLKGAMKSRQIAMSRNRMMAAVGDADVVLVNPTHVAVALTYDEKNIAPTILAAGQGLVATKIREQAVAGGVPIVEDIPLARALFYSCKPGETIPSELYTAVATVLAFVMRLKQHGVAGFGGGNITHHVPGGAPDVPEHMTTRSLRPLRSRRRPNIPAPASNNATVTR